MPFSYLIEKDDETYLVPGVNLRSVGTIRDAQKWPKRDKRTDQQRLDMINYNLLSPYTIYKMMKAVGILKNLQELWVRHPKSINYKILVSKVPLCVRPSIFMVWQSINSWGTP